MSLRKLSAGVQLGLAILAAGLTLVESRTPAADGSPGKRLAFLVGVNNYRHAKLDALQFAERDVEELEIVLKAQGYTVVLLSPSAGKKDAKLIPNRENIEGRLKELLKGTGRDDHILVGLAGHGIELDGSGDSYYCPFDANPSVEKGKGAEPAKVLFPETLVAITGKQGLLRTLDNSGIGRKMLLIDACRNDPESGRGRGVGSTITELPERTWLLLSCSARQRAWETGKLGGGHGVFFHFVLEGLKGKAADSDGEITWNQLAQYVTRQVEKQVPLIIGEGATQSPDQKQSGSGVPVLAIITPVKPVTPVVIPSPSVIPPANTDSAATDPKKEIENSVGMKFRHIPEGTFNMGSPSKYDEDEVPQHEVRITKSFYLGKYEVTQKEWKVVMETEPWKNQPTWNSTLREGDDYPAICIYQGMAIEFCKKLSAKEGKVYRLPTEAEWEYACRAGTKEKYHFGDDETKLAEYGWYTGNAWDKGEKFAHRVGQKKPNPFGLYDMHGNVQEWCQDWYNDKYYARSPKIDPQGAESGSGVGIGEDKSGISSVLRGGSYSSNEEHARCSKRGWHADLGTTSLGFRVLRQIPTDAR